MSKGKKSSGKNGSSKLLLIIAILVVIVACFRTIVNFVTNLLWFSEMGYISVFLRQLFTQLELGIPTFIVITVLTYIYLMALKKGYYKKVDVVDKEFPAEKVVNWVALGISAVFALLATLATATRLWFEILKSFYSTSVGIDDPIFKQDIGFYLFQLDFISKMVGILIGVIVAFFAVTLIYYALLSAMRRPRIFEKAPETEEFAEDEDDARYTGNYKSGYGMFGETMNKAFGTKFGSGAKPNFKAPQLDKSNLKQLLGIASTQFVVLGIIFFLMVGVNFFLKQYDLLYSSGGALYGAGFTDVNVTLWVYRVMMALSVITAVFFAIGIKKRSLKKTLLFPVILIVVSLLGTGVAALVQTLIVSPDELSKEFQYLENNIKYTRYAYGLEDISVEDFKASDDLTKEDVQNNTATFANIRINDYEPTQKYYNQTQSIRTYYDFGDVDVDRYTVNGEYIQAYLSAREIDESVIESYSWLTQHQKYTHGYGIVLSRVDGVTESGQPEMQIYNIPPESEVEEIQITNPAIYYGEMTNNYVIVNTDEKEFDYPQGESNVYTQYEGTGGIKLNFINRLLFAIREGSLKMLVSSTISGDSKIMINRNIETRVKTIAPFLEYDDDPYVVTVDGRIFWIIDAYTYSDKYPYSEPFSSGSGVNYIRNSVKVVVDAYNGDTSFYIVDHEDPIAETLSKIYPKLFKEFSEMPEGLKAHIRYPNTMFTIQANTYTKYHMTDVDVFYQNEDRWAISKEIFGTEEVTMTPQYYIMKLPGETQEEFINSIPYTPFGKQNMMGLLVARNDGEHYGELVLYQLPKSRVTYGPMQVEAQIDQDTTISKEFSLWNSAGSKYNRGNMFVIPVEDSLVYVEPIYLEASNNSLPEVKRVIVYYDGKITYEATLAEALDAMFGSGAGAGYSGSDIEGTGDTGEEGSESGEPSKVLGVDELIVMANEAYEKAVSAQERGDWAAYGQYLNQLEDYLTQLAPQDDGGDANSDQAENPPSADTL